jgi:hypothetical protein
MSRPAADVFLGLTTARRYTLVASVAAICLVPLPAA